MKVGNPVDFSVLLYGVLVLLSFLKVKAFLLCRADPLTLIGDTVGRWKS